MHHAVGDHEGGNQALNAATRSTVVIGAGVAAGMVTGGKLPLFKYYFQTNNLSGPKVWERFRLQSLVELLMTRHRH